jgi:hypothetical protein
MEEEEEQAGKIRLAFVWSQNKSTQWPTNSSRILPKGLHSIPKICKCRSSWQEEKVESSVSCKNFIAWLERNETDGMHHCLSSGAVSKLNVGSWGSDSARAAVTDIVRNSQTWTWQGSPARLLFQNVGAPLHGHLVGRAFLDEHLPGSWIGRKGPILWPLRLDFLWGPPTRHA